MKYLVVLCWLFISTNAVANNTQLTLATTTWCPYTCASDSYEHGIIGEYVTQLLTQANVDVKIASYPWSRAIALANSQQVDGLLTATPVEAPDLLFSSHPISSYQVCFYSHANSEWEYRLPLKFSGKRLGIIQDYGYGEPLDSYLQSHGNSAEIITISGNNGLERLVHMLVEERLDVLPEDKTVIENLLAQQPGLRSQIMEVGCMPASPYYLALTDTKAHQQLLPQISLLLADPKNLARLSKLFEHIHPVAAKSKHSIATQE